MAGNSGIRKFIKPGSHFMESRKWEIIIGIVLFVVACLLLWDSFEGRGKKMPWPAGAMMPW